MRKLCLLFLLWLPIGLSSQNQYPTGFELDGDLYTDQNSTQNTQDWFIDSPNGSQIFYGNKVDSLISLFNFSSNHTDPKLSFYLRGQQSSSPDYMLLDALYQRDYISAASASDATTFITGASKNADHPNTWDVSSKGSPNKGDLVDVFSLLRRAGNSLNGDLWFMGAASTLTANGDKHIDFEFYKKELSYENEAFQSMGTSGGRTAWTFSSQGEILQAGDLIISLDFVNGGKDLEKSIRIWVDASSFPNKDLTSQNTVLPFQLTGNFNQGINSGEFGYAEILLPHGSSDLIVRKNDQGKTTAVPWGTLNGPQAKLTSEYSSNQWVEIAVNLSALGLDPNLQKGSVCGAPLGTVLVKTRSSHSFTAQLKDFVVPMKFGNEAEWGLDITVPDLSCLQEQVIPELGELRTDLVFTWEGPNNFYSEETHPQIRTAGTYIVSVGPAQGCVIKDTIVIGEDREKPDLHLSEATLTCDQTSIDLVAISAVSNADIQWLGPNGQTTTGNTWTVDQEGWYYATATHPRSACQITDSVQVLSDTFTPEIETQHLILNCFQPKGRPTVNLSQASNYQYSWTGPGGFTSHELQPLIDGAGTYNLVVKNLANGCEKDADLIVTADIKAPILSFQDDTITCQETHVQLFGTIQAGRNYQTQWSGPGSFTSTDSFPFVDTEGTYTLQVTNKQNGCSSSTSTNITNQQVFENFRLQGGEITCLQDSVLLLSGLNESGFTYQWTGPNGFSSTSEEVYVHKKGTYTLSVSHASGCSAIDSIVVISSKNIPQVNLPDSLNLTCQRTSWRPSGLPSTYRYQWSGDNGYSSTSSSPNINRAGTYTVRVTDPNSSCDTSLTVKIGEDKLAPTVRITGGILTCSSPTAELSFEVSGVNNYTFYWLLPNGLISRDSSFLVDAEGLYRLYVRNPDNGCLTLASYNVRDENRPISLRGTVGTLSCATDSVQLQFTATSGTSFNILWKGPNGFSSTDTSPWVKEIGSYYLQVTDTTSGCSGSLRLQVRGDYDPPVFTLRKSGDLNCQNDQVLLYAFPSNNYSFEWYKDSVIIGTGGTIAVREPGTYAVQVRNLSTGCLKTDSVQVHEFLQVPTASAYAKDTLSCINTSIHLSLDDSSTGSHTYVWRSPSGFYSTQKEPSVNRAGVYSLSIKDNESRCDTVLTVEVLGDPTPLTVTTQGGTITCINPDVKLEINYDESRPVSFSWTGPNGFVSKEAEPRVYLPGYYQLTITDTVMGCQASVYARILDDSQTPNVQVSSGTLACLGSSTQLTVQYSIGSYDFQWTGPNGFNSQRSSPTVTEPGTYTLQLTDRETGCFNVDSTELIRVSIPVPISIVSQGELSCGQNSVQLSSGDSGSGLSSAWTGANGFYSQNASVDVSDPGTYFLTLSNLISGCSTVDSIEIVRKQTPLPLTILGEGKLTCVQSSSVLSIENPRNYLVYEWKGPQGFSSEEEKPSVSQKGTYFLTIIDTMSQCSGSDSIHIITDFEAPLFALADTGFSCEHVFLELGTDLAQGMNYQYQWAGPSNFSAHTAQIIVQEPGSYLLQVINPRNGCETTDTLIVDEMPPCSDAVCTMTQGFYGNDSGRFCDGRTTREVLEDILETDLVLGSGENTFTLTRDELDDFFQRMPGGGTSEPLHGNATCANPVGIALDRKGQLSNNLLAQTLTLGINLRLGSNLANVILEDSRMITFASSACQDTDSKPISGTGRSFHLPSSVISYLNQASIAELYIFANAALDGTYVPQDGSPGYGEITAAVGAINDGFDKCRILKEFQPNSEETPEWIVSGYPNPSGGEPVVVSFMALESGEATLSLHDIITGVTLAIPMSEEVNIGQSYQVSFPVDQLPEGTYFYLLRLNERIVGKGNIQVYH